MLVFMHVATSKMGRNFINTNANNHVTLLANIIIATYVVANFSYLSVILKYYSYSLSISCCSYRLRNSLYYGLDM